LPIRHFTSANQNIRPMPIIVQTFYLNDILFIVGKTSPFCTLGITRLYVNGVASIEATEAEASVKKSTAKIKIKYKLL